MATASQQHDAFLYWLGCCILESQTEEDMVPLPREPELLEKAFKAGWGWGASLGPAILREDSNDGC